MMHSRAKGAMVREERLELHSWFAVSFRSLHFCGFLILQSKVLIGCLWTNAAWGVQLIALVTRIPPLESNSAWKIHSVSVSVSIESLLNIRTPLTMAKNMVCISFTNILNYVSVIWSISINDDVNCKVGGLFDPNDCNMLGDLSDAWISTPVHRPGVGM